MCKNNIIAFIHGFFIGVFSILPGLSGSLLASYFGDYQLFIDILHYKKYSIKNVIYISCVIVGILISLLFTSNFILNVYNNHIDIFKIVLVIVFIIMIIKYILKERNSAFEVLLLILLSFLFNSFLLSNVSINNSFFLYFLAGVFFSAGKIIPGLSSSLLLLNINFYRNVLHFFSNPFMYLNFYWFIFTIGFILTAFICYFFLVRFYKTNFFKKLILFILFSNLLLLIKNS